MTLGHLDRDSEAYVRGVAQSLSDSLGDRLTGVYLHGSGALGGFAPGGCSDIDVLGVVGAPLDELSRRRVSQILIAAGETCPAAGGFEFSLITAIAAADPSPAPPYELHLSVDKGLVRGESAVDHDLPSYFAVCRERGVAVLGPDPKEIFGDVDIRWVVHSWLADMRWAEQNAPQAYRVLNACRIWRSMEEGGFFSKMDGADWARERVEDPALIDAAMAFQRGMPGPPVDRIATSAFVDGVLKSLRFPT